MISRVCRLSLGVGSVVALGFASALQAQEQGLGNAERGRRLFVQNCALCHSNGQANLPASGQGPILAGVIDRPAGSVPNFAYTKALRASGVVWNADTLDKFLTLPSAFVPGTAMAVVIPRRVDRRDLIAYLASLPPLPSSAGRAKDVVGHPGPGDWTNDAPGVRHRVRLSDLPAPYATVSSGNGPETVDRPAGAHLSVPAGFTIKLFASGFDGPRLLRTAPNGDLFIAETRAGNIRVLRMADGADKPSESGLFAQGLQGPFGIAFYPLGAHPKWVYVANLDSVVRYPYENGDLQARGPQEVVVSRLVDTTGGHSTRDIVFTPDGERMLVSVGSGSNVAEGLSRKTPDEVKAWEAEHGYGTAWGYEAGRADVLWTDPQGRKPLKVYASGIRNAVGIAIQPATGQLWVSVNERDGLGDDLVPDYITHVREGGFYGWPWYYLGNYEDPRHAGERPDLAGKAIVPDVLLQAHSASLELAFYTATSGVAAFPAEYRGDIFAAEHGSWNRSIRTGTKVIRVRLRQGRATGEYDDFVTGFTVDNHSVWGRPVGVAVGHDGALFVTDDAGGTLWRIAYTGGR